MKSTRIALVVLTLLVGSVGCNVLFALKYDAEIKQHALDYCRAVFGKTTRIPGWVEKNVDHSLYQIYHVDLKNDVLLSHANSFEEQRAVLEELERQVTDLDKKNQVLTHDNDALEMQNKSLQMILNNTIEEIKTVRELIKPVPQSNSVVPKPNSVINGAN